MIPPSQPRREYGIIFEFIPQGRYVKVSAINARTGFEVCIVGDRRMPLATLKKQATQKLLYVSKKKKQTPP
jgi:hypothetical protein